MIFLSIHACLRQVGYVSAPNLIQTYSAARGFSFTSAVEQRPEHPLYKLLDWGQIKAGNRAIIDPFDPSAILYVSQREYLSLVKIAVSNDSQLTVLATPSDNKIKETSSSSGTAPTSSDSSTDSSKTTPPISKEKKLSQKRKRLAELAKDFLVPDDLKPKSFVKWSRGSMSWRSWFERFATPVQSGSVRRLLLPTERNLSVLLRRWGYVLGGMTDIHWGPGIKADLFEFSNHCVKLLRTQGVLAMTIRLRTYLFCVNQYLAGNPLSSTGHLGVNVRLSCGLPTAMPLGARAHIRARRPAYIRFWSSMLNSYRAFQTTPKELSMGRVCDAPFQIVPQEEIDFSNFLHRYWIAWTTKNPDLTKPDLMVRKFPLLSSAGPNDPVSILGSRLDALAWVRSGKLLNLFRAWKAFGVEDVVVETFFASLARGQAHWLSKSTTPIAWACERIWTGRSPTFPLTNDGFEEVKYASSIPGLRIVVKNPSPEVLHLKPAVRRSNVLQNPGFEVQPGSHYNTKLKRWEPELLTNDLIARYARWVWDSLHDTGEVNTVALQQVHAVANAPAPQNILPSPPETERFVNPVLGKLSFKYGEPAGKTRWFAIVDYFTQQCLQPLHDYLFSCLKTFPGDATFDQTAAVVRMSTMGPHYWSYDLTAATDTIPQQLYRLVFSVFLGPKEASAWVNLLVDRVFVLKAGSVPQHLRRGASSSTYLWSGRYTRGQPMGALSSWGALALVHHLLVQYAAWRVGQNSKYTFDRYTVLGDDIVIADKSVAAEYLRVCASLGVEINTKKSFVSEKGFFQFAQQNVLNGVNVSPLSLREETNVDTIQDRAAMVRRAIDRSYFVLPETGTPNLIQTLVRRFVSPNQSLHLTRNVWANPTGLGVDIASKIVAPLLLQPRGPLSGLLRPSEGTVWEWLQSLSQAFGSGKSLFYRGTTISDSQAVWESTDLGFLYQAIIVPLLDRFEQRVRVIRDGYHKLEREVNRHRHNVPLLPVAWILRIWKDELPIYDRGNHFLAKIRKLIHPGLPKANLPALLPGTRVPPQGVAAGLSALSKLLDYLERFNTPFDLEKTRVLQPKRSHDKHTERIRRIWMNSTLASSSRAPPTGENRRGNVRGQTRS